MENQKEVDITENRCVYCGTFADCRDHIIPISFLRGTGDRRGSFVDKINLVRACSECNHIAGSKVFSNLDDKREYIQSRLKQKYKKLLLFPSWNENELEEMSQKFKQIIRLKQRAKLVIEYRLAWPSVEKNDLAVNDFIEVLKLLTSILEGDRT